MIGKWAVQPRNHCRGVQLWVGCGSPRGWRVKGRFRRAPCKGGAFQWVRAPPGDSLQPEAIGAVMEVTKWLKPSDSGSRIGDCATTHWRPYPASQEFGIVGKICGEPGWMRSGPVDCPLHRLETKPAGGIADVRGWAWWLGAAALLLLLAVAALGIAVTLLD